MRTLLIDNYDSYTYNLYQLLAEINGRKPTVITNDDPRWRPEMLDDFDNLVISPGPGHPANQRDLGICKAAVSEARVPVLGVCLGHQAIAHALGGAVDYADEVMHGRLSEVLHTGDDLFEGIPSPLKVVRYHSINVSDTGSKLEATAWTRDGILMALRHKGRPLWGVQFHPESVATECGRELLGNFRQLTLSGGDTRLRTNNGHTASGDVIHVRRPTVVHQELSAWVDPAAAYSALFADAEYGFWLDSSVVVPGLSRYSIMGDTSGPMAEFVSYDLASGQTTVESQQFVRSFTEDIFGYLDRQLGARRTLTPDLPFEFNLGYVGYFGYELKGLLNGETAHSSTQPDAAFLFVDRCVVFDHQAKVIYLLTFDEMHDEGAARWVDDMRRRLIECDSPDLEWLADLTQPDFIGAVDDGDPLPVNWRHSRDDYLALIGKCHDYINRGESYELCLCNEITVDTQLDPLATYLALRRLNPAPYSALLKLGRFSVLSASPERYLTVTHNGRVESKPIKGTARRGTTPVEDMEIAAKLAADEKERAENLMVVDLVRNDLGSVCEVGSVQVPVLFAIESYKTVHQLVSTIEGQLPPERTTIDVVRASFPGGSMTGAPKKRTMELLDYLESGSRGIYSGSLGYLGLNGSADLSIVIRTMVLTDEQVRIGVGGAITALADAEAEYNEILLKSSALMITIMAVLRHSVDVCAAESEDADAR
ncbi:MAG: aminodeoxychorismate synthase component I [Sciscionella sp.]